MSSVSSAQSAAALWWKRPSLPRTICCSAPNAMPTTTPPSAPPATKPSCQVDWCDDSDRDGDRRGQMITRRTNLLLVYLDFFLKMLQASIYFYIELEATMSQNPKVCSQKEKYEHTLLKKMVKTTIEHVTTVHRP